MRIEDLSVGDWVKIGDKVKRVDYLYGKDNVCDMPIEMVEPIPITAEILEKNGFRKNSKSPLYANYSYADNIYVDVYKNEWVRVEVYSNDGMNLVTKAVIKHTHQLQHALRLAGVGKEIEV